MPHRASKSPLNGVMRVKSGTLWPDGSLAVDFECADCRKKFSVRLGEKLPKCPCWTREEKCSPGRHIAGVCDDLCTAEPAPPSAERCPSALNDRADDLRRGDEAQMSGMGREINYPMDRVDDAFSAIPDYPSSLRIVHRDRIRRAIDLAVLAARVETAEHICEMKDFEREQERDRLRREMEAMRGR